MELIQARNAHQALPLLIEKIQRTGIKRNSRDGEVLVFPEPTTIIYSHPQERVLFWPERDANPFFHLFESLYFLAGRRDVKFLEQFVKRIATYSDDGKNLHASYGHRWRKHFKFDQIGKVIEGLKKNKDCRRQYIGMWDPKTDLGRTGKDLPCNVGISFQINSQDELDMVVHNRSNDSCMGALGSNAVHMSILQEYIAKGVGVSIGRYWQISSNMHLYQRDLQKVGMLSIHAPDPYRTRQRRSPYEKDEVKVTPVVDSDIRFWDQDLMFWLKEPAKVGLRSNFLRRTATPMYMAHKAYKNGDLQAALEIVETQMPEMSDWKIASKEWLERRRK